MDDRTATLPQTPLNPLLAHFHDDALEDSITTLAANIAAATSRLLKLIAEFDRREAWAGPGLNSCAHWLNWKCGIDLGAAREKVRVAKALERLPQISAAFDAGTVSYSKVRAMTRVATLDNEEDLLNIARHGTAMHVEQTVRAYRQLERIEETEKANRAHGARRLDWHYDDDGMLVIRAKLPAEAGAMLPDAPAAVTEDLAELVRAAGVRISAETCVPNWRGERLDVDYDDREPMIRSDSISSGLRCARRRHWRGTAPDRNRCKPRQWNPVIPRRTRRSISPIRS
jgi:hypothetical protein